MERNEYLKLAEVEDRMWYFRCLHARLRLAVKPAMEAKASARLLDAGCGTGGFLLGLKKKEPLWQAEGVDLSSLACEIARSRGVTVQEAAIEKLPYPEKHFNAIVSGDVLYHIDEPFAALKEFARCLRSGGLVAINVPAYRWLWSYHDDRVSSKHRFTRDQVLKLFAAVKLRPVSSTYWNTLPFPLIVLRRKVFPPRDESSDVKLSSPPVEIALRAAMAAERGWNRLGLRLPFGSSIFAVAMKE
ncbi:MAG TPA: class I SAM-dependent methyltransferase [Opitutaceae bacterium]|nr:class I SAM-dependent methyltransferase [Opitutaceae bacterium]